MHLLLLLLTASESLQGGTGRLLLCSRVKLVALSSMDPFRNLNIHCQCCSSSRSSSRRRRSHCGLLNIRGHSSSRCQRGHSKKAPCYSSSSSSVCWQEQSAGSLDQAVLHSVGSSLVVVVVAAACCGPKGQVCLVPAAIQPPTAHQVSTPARILVLLLWAQTPAGLVVVLLLV